MRKHAGLLMALGLLAVAGYNGTSMKTYNSFSFSKPIYYLGKSQKKKKSNRIIYAHKAKLKRRIKS